MSKKDIVMITISTPHTFKTLNNKILSIYKFHSSSRTMEISFR